jgi:hypothetical protein
MAPLLHPKSLPRTPKAVTSFMDDPLDQLWEKRGPRATLCPIAPLVRPMEWFFLHITTIIDVNLLLSSNIV